MRWTRPGPSCRLPSSNRLDPGCRFYACVRGFCEAHPRRNCYNSGQEVGYTKENLSKKGKSCPLKEVDLMNWKDKLKAVLKALPIWVVMLGPVLLMASMIITGMLD